MKLRFSQNTSVPRLLLAAIFAELKLKLEDNKQAACTKQALGASSFVSESQNYCKTTPQETPYYKLILSVGHMTMVTNEDQNSQNPNNNIYPKAFFSKLVNNAGDTEPSRQLQPDR